MTTEAHFEQIEAKLLEELSKAQRSIVVAVAWLTNNKLFNKLCERAQSGLGVELMVVDDDINKESPIDFTRLRTAGGKLHLIVQGSDGEIMHNKFCVIDKSTVITGSYNWSHRANNNHENITIIRSNEKMANDFMNEFQRIRDTSLAHNSKSINRIEEEQVMKRMALLKMLVNMNEEDAIQAVLSKIPNDTGDNFLDNIVNFLIERQYDTALQLIEVYEKRQVPGTLVSFLAKFSDRSNFAAHIISRYYPLTEELIERNAWYWEYLSDNIAMRWHESLIQRHIEFWDMNRLSRNPKVPWSNDILSRFENKWDWWALSGNLNLPWSKELIERFKDRWNWQELCRNTAIPWSIEILEHFSDKVDWFILSRNTSLPWSESFIERYKDRWSWDSLSENVALPWSVALLERYLRKWQWGYVGSSPDPAGLSGNSALPWSEALITHYKEKWSWYNHLHDSMSMNSGIPYSESLIDCFKDNWEFSTLSYNTRLPWSEALIKRYEDRWSWVGLSRNTALPWSESLVDCYKGKWAWDELSGNTALPWSDTFLERYKDKWKWGGRGDRISANTAIPWSISLIDRYRDEWSWNALSRNRALPWSEDLIDRYRDKWDWDLLSQSTFMPWSEKLIARFKNYWNWWLLGANAEVYRKVISPFANDEVVREVMKQIKQRKG